MVIAAGTALFLYCVGATVADGAKTEHSIVLRQKVAAFDDLLTLNVRRTETNYEIDGVDFIMNASGFKSFMGINRLTGSYDIYSGPTVAAAHVMESGHCEKKNQKF